jgi:alanine dehydrogenase
VIPLRMGEITTEHLAADLGEVVTGRKPGRRGPDEITLFKSIGVAIEDIALAAHVYEKAVAQEVGTVMKI